MLGAPSCGHVLDRGVVHTHIDVGCAQTARDEQVTSEFVAHVHRGKKIPKVMLRTTGRERHAHRRGPMSPVIPDIRTLRHRGARRPARTRPPRPAGPPGARRRRGRGPEDRVLPERLVSEIRALLSSRSSTRLKLRRRRRRVGPRVSCPRGWVGRRRSPRLAQVGIDLFSDCGSVYRSARVTGPVARRPSTTVALAGAVWQRARDPGHRRPRVIPTGRRGPAGPDRGRAGTRAISRGHIESSAAPLSDLVFERGACDAQAFEPIRVLLTHLRKCIRKVHPAAST